MAARSRNRSGGSTGESRTYRRESDLLQARTVAILDFARRAFADAEGESDCDRQQGVLLEALEALPVEFDEAAMKSVTDLAGVGTAVEHARASLRRAEEACVLRPDDPEDSRFRGDAKKMILDALELGSARKEHSRCMDGRLEQVCARPGGLDSHLRIVGARCDPDARARWRSEWRWFRKNTSADGPVSAVQASRPEA